MTKLVPRIMLVRALSLLAIGLGLLTMKAGRTVLIGGDATRAAAGNYVPFVLCFNFAAGFAYVIVGVGLWLRPRWGHASRSPSRSGPHSLSPSLA